MSNKQALSTITISLLERSIALNKSSRVAAKSLLALAEMIAETVTAGGTVYLVASTAGGVAACDMFAANMVGLFSKDRPGIPVISLCSNPTLQAAMRGRFHVSEVYSRQISTLANAGDMVLALEGTAQAQEITEAVRAMRLIGGKAFVMCWNTPPQWADEFVLFPSHHCESVSILHMAALDAVAAALDAAPAEVTMDDT